MPIAAHLPEIAPGLPLAWLATYLLHSTLLLGAAWLASRLLRGRALGVEEALWKAALLGGLLTAAVQTGVAGLGAPAPGEAMAAAPAAASIASAAAELSIRPAGAPPAPAAARAATDPRLSTLAAVLPGWQRLLLALWVLGAAVLTLGLGLSWLRLRSRLRGRRELTGGPVRDLLDRLLHQAAGAAGRSGVDAPGRRVRLTGTSALPVPVALGVGEREICLPRRVLTDLEERSQRGLLAHELAHLERRDPAWLLASRAIECLLFLQPLNRVARARLQEISELRCDEWALAATGDRVGLAGCLTEIAGWLAGRTGGGRAALPVPGMARGPKRLGERVRRILEGPAEAPSARRRWLPAAAAALLLAGVLLVPGLAPSIFAVPQEEAPQGAAAEGAGPEGEAPEGEGPAGTASEDDGPEEGDLEDEGYEQDGLDYDYDFEHEDDHDYDFDHDFDFDFDFDFELPDPGEISDLVAEAMEAQREALEELAELKLERHLSPEEHAELAAELRAAHQEIARAMAEAQPAFEELERLNLELREELADGLRLAHEELAEVDRHLREELEVDLRAAQEEIERAHEEVRRAHRELEKNLHRDLRGEQEEVRRELERAREEARRELEIERRGLEEQRRELEEEREERRRELERLRRELREETGEAAQEPPR